MSDTASPGLSLADITCPFCKGSGMIDWPMAQPGGVVNMVQQPCMSCTKGLMHPAYYKRVYTGEKV